ncbi:putative membrane protein [Candidatus Phytoplasma solani]|uniref:hypothetical protein n=1 Tax=Candidatus Phytoplasma solani TaxID=69896 RepID=UPI0032D9EEC2
MKGGQNINYLKTKKRHFFLLIFLIFFIKLTYTLTPIAGNQNSSYFQCRTKSVIKLADNEELQQEWLKTQPKLKRYDLNIISKADIPKLMELFNVNGVSLYGSSGSPPGHNSRLNKIVGTWWFKNPPKGLMGVYLKPRTNPFNQTYPCADYKYTLEEILKYEIEIEEAFLFWDAKEKPHKIQPQINLVVTNIFTDQNKEEEINNYLMKNNIIKEPKLIKLGCYNATPTTGLVLPLPSKTFCDIPIEAIYFDDGIRILPEDNQNCNIEDLLKLSNGAKNTYLFSFNVQERPKPAKKNKYIELPPSLDPYQAIRDWKRENNLFTFPPLTLEAEYVEKIEHAETYFEVTSPCYRKFNIPVKLKTVFCYFETDDTIYSILCGDRIFKSQLVEKYRNNLIEWVKQCYIKYGVYYSEAEVRAILGRCSKTLYDENGNTHYYEYVTNIFFDDWYIDGNKTAKTYYQFLDTTRPPQKPKELE